MRSALVGHTGFVGGNLLRQAPFDDLFNSKNVGELAGREYDLLVCAGAPAEKWKANADPEGDRAALARLMEPLARAKARRVVLVSTVDVYPRPIEVDEDTPIDPDAGGAYGRNRLALERFVRERFDTLVVRLPGLYGPGLKKNAIYDLLKDNQVEKIHAEGVFQFYGLERLWPDVTRFLEARLEVVNLAVEPVSVREIARFAFGREFTNVTPNAPARYDFRSKHAARFGGAGGWFQDAATALDGIRRFVAAERAAR
jgi:nucleoside-diphosphate-sugar epimerase